VELSEGIRKSRDRNARWRPLSSDLRGSLRQDLSNTLLEGEGYLNEGNGWQWEWKGIFQSRGTRGKKRELGFRPEILH